MIKSPLSKPDLPCEASDMGSDSTKDLLVTDREYLPVVKQLISNAKRSIDLLAYSFSIGPNRAAFHDSTPSFEIASLLVKAKQARGVKLRIRVYLEGHRDASAKNRITARFLEKNGIEIKMGRTHAKAICIDHRYLLVGSTNLTNQSISTNHETNVVTSRAAICRGFKKYFEHYWEDGEHGEVELARPLFADGDFKKPLLSLINKSKKFLEFSIYFFDHEEIAEALIRAHQRKVNITALVHDHRSFALSYVRRTSAMVKKLKAAGITNISFGPDRLFTHSKFIISDRKQVLLGTGNWIEEDFVEHPQLYVLLNDANLARELCGRLLATIESL